MLFQFFVATVHEALELVPYIGQHNIYILSDDVIGNYEIIKQHGFIPVIHSLRAYEFYKNKWRYLLNFDIGMSRLGIPIDDIGYIDDTKNMLYLMSHYSNAWNAERVEIEYARFETIRHALKPDKTTLSASPSFDLAEHQNTDMIRVGALLYGLEDNGRILRSIVTIKVRIIQILFVPRGEFIGYGNTYEAPRNMKIATIALGYGSGVHVSLSNCGVFIVEKNGVRHSCRVVGFVNMDMTMIDVSDVDGCTTDDEVIICDDQHTLYEVTKGTSVRQNALLCSFRFEHCNYDTRYLVE